MVDPKKAAACIIMDPDGSILMGTRSLGMRFMGGHHVFPGGRVDDSEDVDHVIGFSSSEDALSVKAACREVFEETGLLLTQGDLPDVSERRSAREELLAERVTFNQILQEFEMTVDFSHFIPAATWMTPGNSPIRFDTRYFLYHYSGDQEPELLDGEFTALEWIKPLELRRRWHEGEVRVSAPVSCTLRHFSALPYPECLDLLRLPTDRRPGMPKWFEMRRGLYLVPVETETILPATHTNCIVVGEDEVLVIDPGSDKPEELEYLGSLLDHLLGLGGSIKAVVLTHSHPDHTAGVGFVRDRYKVPVWAHEAVAPQVDFDIDRHIQDEEILELAGEPGWRLRALHTPGHDPGHLCFYEESTRTLLCGDMIANPGTIVVSHAYGGNMNEFLASLERLMEIEEANLIIPAHGMAQSDPRERLGEHLKHRLWREEKIHNAYDQGSKTLKELLATAYDDAPVEALPLAEHALQAHLARLGIELSD